jgi:hypothetical protein
MAVLSDPDRVLRNAAVLFAVASAIHNADHVRRGGASVTNELLGAGQAALVVSTVVIVLVLTRHHLAPLLAAVAGFSLAIAYAAAHWLPHWSALSDSFVDQHVSAFTRFASLLEIVAGAGLGLAGVYALRRQDAFGGTAREGFFTSGPTEASPSG